MNDSSWESSRGIHPFQPLSCLRLSSFGEIYIPDDKKVWSTQLSMLTNKK